MLFTANEYQQLIDNGKTQRKFDTFLPVVKWIIPEFDFTFLAVLIKPFTGEIEIAHGFGLKDNGKEQLSRAYIRINGNHKELVGMDARKDNDFVGKFPLWVYEKIAKEQGTLITNRDTVKVLLDGLVPEREIA
ncbi:Protein of unknown function (DUF2958) [Aquimarina sp. MAR_2010_214]|uniref:DUF2958 domain-containing protein n=1 Tax=Aquimarina sp. MAR_2010_214 TaxID=1250026 RepID=UPI000C70BFD3|nr:DUF2958 domain-containing protein [Aquimarina sp. MAR_2010_214]PKV50858.1 Protein of unknown function (DUF2958) [Aquimarina sp. MAR_2010_214]